MGRIRQARRRAGLSQEELAKAADVSPATVVQVELGHRQPQGRTLRKLAKALGVEVTDLLGGWQEAFESSQRFRATAKERLEERLSLWEAARDEGASDKLRRRLLDEGSRILDEATEVLTKLQENLSEGLDRMSEPGPNPYWEEVRKVDTLYRELWAMVEGAGLSVRTVKRSSAARPHQHELESLTA